MEEKEFEFDNKSGTYQLIQILNRLERMEQQSKQMHEIMSNLIQSRPYKNNKSSCSRVSSLFDDSIDSSAICVKQTKESIIMSIHNSLASKKLGELAKLWNIEELLFNIRLCMLNYFF
jgi:hypothetical protein